MKNINTLMKEHSAFFDGQLNSTSVLTILDQYRAYVLFKLHKRLMARQYLIHFSQVKYKTYLIDTRIQLIKIPLTFFWLMVILFYYIYYKSNCDQEASKKILRNNFSYHIKMQFL